MNPKLLKKRLKALYSSWEKYKKEIWGNSDVLVICTPPSDSPENLSHPLSSHFFLWLLGHDFPDTVAVFTRTAIYFLPPLKKMSMLQTLIDPAMEGMKTRVLVYKKDIRYDSLAWVDDIVRDTRVSGAAEEGGESHQPFVIGCIFGEYPKSKLIWSAFNCDGDKSKPSKYECACVKSGFAKLFDHGDNFLGDLERSKRGNIQVLMHHLPVEFEEMLSLTDERNEKLAGEMPPKDKENKVFGEKGNGIPSMLNEDCLVSSDECDRDWVLVEADDKEQ